MESNFSSHILSPKGDFGFTYKIINFSDRFLRIKIMSLHVDSMSNGEGWTSIADWLVISRRQEEKMKLSDKREVPLTK